MGIDQSEPKRRRNVDKVKPKYAPLLAIPKAVFDSDAYTHLSFSARDVLCLLARWLGKDQNGHIKVSETQAAEHGIERKTFRRALKELQAHQLVVMTWRGGKVQGACSKYALTWLRIQYHTGIRADGFRLNAWKDWKPPEGKKTDSRKCPQDRAENVPLKAISSPKMSPTPGDKNGPVELISHISRTAEPWVPGYVKRLADVGLRGRQCSPLPPIRVAP